MAEPALAIEGLVTGYDRRDVLTGISINVAEGSLVTVVGPNGHGKSTLLRAISTQVFAQRSAHRFCWRRRFSPAAAKSCFLRPEETSLAAAVWTRTFLRWNNLAPR